MRWDFQMRVSVGFYLWIEVSESEQNPRWSRVSVKFPQSVMVWSSVSSAAHCVSSHNIPNQLQHKMLISFPNICPGCQNLPPNGLELPPPLPPPPGYTDESNWSHHLMSNELIFPDLIYEITDFITIRIKKFHFKYFTLHVMHTGFRKVSLFRIIYRKLTKVFFF